MYPNAQFFVKDTHDSLVWWGDIPKPTDDEIIAFYESHKHEWAKDQMKQQRNMLLVACEYCALPDFPNRDQWLVYRQLLRDLPETWSESNPVFQTKPE